MDILIVDDSVAARYFLRSCIPGDQGHEVREAKDGRDGLDQFLAKRPDLTFLDLTMPVMDGFETLRKIRELAPDSLVAVITSDVQKKTMERIYALGAFRLLKKPPSRETIVQTLDTAAQVLNGGGGHD